MIPIHPPLPASESVRSRIQAALESGSTGELVIQKPSVTARVFVARGALAWVYCEGQKVFLVDRLVLRVGLTRADLRELVTECRTQRRQFGDFMVDSGLVDEGVMRSCLEEHIGAQLTLLESAPGPTRSLFLPLLRAKFESRFTFHLDEVLAPPKNPTQSQKATVDMSGVQETLSKVVEIEGAFAAALVDHESGMTLGTAGGRPDFDIELAAAGNTAVVRAKMKVMDSLGIQGGISDILITLDDQYHLIRPLGTVENFFLYVAIDKKSGNLAMARHKLATLEKSLVI